MRTELLRSHWHYILYEDEAGLLLEVLCGTIAQYALEYRLTDEEAARFRSEGQPFIDSLADQIVYSPQKFAQPATDSETGLVAEESASINPASDTRVDAGFVFRLWIALVFGGPLAYVAPHVFTDTESSLIYALLAGVFGTFLSLPAFALFFTCFLLVAHRPWSDLLFRLFFFGLTAASVLVTFYVLDPTLGGGFTLAYLVAAAIAAAAIPLRRGGWRRLKIW